MNSINQSRMHAYKLTSTLTNKEINFPKPRLKEPQMLDFLKCSNPYRYACSTTLP